MKLRYQPAGEETSAAQPRLAVVDAADPDPPEMTETVAVAPAAAGPVPAGESEPAPPRRRPPAASRRTRRTVNTPASVGCRAEEAIEALRASGLNPAIEHEQTPHDDERGLVLAQDPDAGEPLARGATVALWVGAPVDGADAPAEPSGVPDGPPAGVEEAEVDDPADAWFEIPPGTRAQPDQAGPGDPGDRPEPGRDERATTREASADTAPATAGNARRVGLASITLAAGLLLFVVAPHLLGHHSSSPPAAPTAPATAGRPAPPSAPRRPRPPAPRPKRSPQPDPAPRHRRPRPPRRTPRHSHRHRHTMRHRQAGAEHRPRPVPSSASADSPAPPADTSPGVAEAPTGTATSPEPAPAEPEPASPATSPKSAVEQEFTTP